MATKRRTTKKKVSKKVAKVGRKTRKKIVTGLGLHEIALLQDVDEKVSRINHAVSPKGK